MKKRETTESRSFCGSGMLLLASLSGSLWNNIWCLNKFWGGEEDPKCLMFSGATYLNWAQSLYSGAEKFYPKGLHFSICFSWTLWNFCSVSVKGNVSALLELEILLPLFIVLFDSPHLFLFPQVCKGLLRRNLIWYMFILSILWQITF